MFGALRTIGAAVPEPAVRQAAPTARTTTGIAARRMPRKLTVSAAQLRAPLALSAYAAGAAAPAASRPSPALPRVRASAVRAIRPARTSTAPDRASLFSTDRVRDPIHVQVLRC